jgi:uncharacterized protein YndB with AHSA1/START domain
MAKKQKENELYITRYYDAPVAAVWDAWTDPAQAAHWWGPRGFTITTHGKDLRPGGYWAYTMHGPDGVDYPNKAVYHEVEKHAKLVYDHGGNDDRPPLFRVTVLFSEKGGKTKMEMTMALATKEAAEQTNEFIKKAGGHSTWDRLGEYLEKEESGKEAFIINRTFNAPIDVVFDAWTDPKQLAQWLSPAGTTMEFLEADIRSGGKSSYKMGNDSFTMYGRASYIKVERPNLLVYTQQFCDKDGNISRHPLAPTWPETMLTHVYFTEVEEGKTLVNVHWEVTGPASAEEMQTFIAGRSGMTQGWTGSFDKLEKHL